MIKKLTIIISLLMPTAMMAQSNWELPQEMQQAYEQQKEKKADKKAEKEKKKAVTTEVINGKTYTIKIADKPYLKGAVPEKEGKVVFVADIETKGQTAKEVYDKVYQAMAELAKDKNQTGRSKVALINKEELSIVGTYEEWLVFSDKILELDRTRLSYIIVATCKEGSVNVSIERLSYEYGEDERKEYMTAEQTITDRLMLANDGTKLKKRNSKFRKATVDRMREILSDFRKELK